MVATVAAIAVLLLTLGAEWLHARRTRRIARLAFGPSAHPRAFVHGAPVARSLGFALLAWGLVTLYVLDPKFHRPKEPPPSAQKRILIALDVSPSMNLSDAGDKKDQTRAKRAAKVLMSVLDRISLDQARVTVVAFYTGAKPVVIDTKDPAVVKNIVDDLPLDQAFDPGKTTILEGVEEAFTIAKPWREKSATFMLITDGDTVPYTGMPAIPPSIARVLVIGVGDPRVGKFIDGHQSRQAGMTLRQIATRLGGTYHDANDRNVPTQLISEIAGLLPMKDDSAAGKRELAIAATGTGGALVALVPLSLALFGTGYRPGRRVNTRAPGASPSPSTPRPMNAGREPVPHLEGAAHA